MNEHAFLAMARAFRDCRASDDRSRNACAYLSRKYLAAIGEPYDEQELNSILDQWYSERRHNPTYRPQHEMPDTGEPMDSGDADSAAGGQQDD